MNYFTIVGNGRTGSTWLVTNFDRLQDVVARREFKWRPCGYQPQAIHVPIDGRAGEVIARLNELVAVGSASSDIRAVGSKLVLDPFDFYGPSVFEAIDAATAPAFLVLLTRSYLESFLSWKLRGVAHQLTSDASALSGADPVLVAAVHNLRPRLPAARVLLTGDGFPGGPANETDEVCAFSEAVDFMLRFFQNDIKLLEIIQNRRQGAVVDYGEIPQQFPRLAAVIGSRASDTEIDAVIETPTMEKLPMLSSSQVTPSGVLDEISTALRSVFRQINRGLISARDVWQWSDGYKHAIIRIPALAKIVARNNRTVRAEVECAASYGLRWRVQASVRHVH